MSSLIKVDDIIIINKNPKQSHAVGNVLYEKAKVIKINTEYKLPFYTVKILNSSRLDPSRRYMVVYRDEFDFVESADKDSVINRKIRQLYQKFESRKCPQENYLQ